MAFFDDEYLFTNSLPTFITLERNRGRKFIRRTTETSWFLWPLEFFVSIGDAISGSLRRSSEHPLWEAVTFQKDGALLLEAGRKKMVLEADDILLVSGERGLNPSAAQEGEMFSLLGWKYVELVCKGGTHQIRLSPDACSRVFTLAAQTNPYVVGVDAAHQIYLPETLKQDESAQQRDAVLEAATRILSARASRSVRRAVFALFGAGLFAAATVGWILAGLRVRNFFIVLPIAALAALVLALSSVADGWDIKKRVTRLRP
jgi:hypothetical protein